MTLSAVPPRRRFALLLGAVAGALLAPWCAGSAQAQDRTVVIGSPSATPVTVDLSVLDAGGGVRGTGTYGNLLFPGSRHKPGQRVILNPPGTVANRPVLRRPGRTRPPRRALARRPVSQPTPAPVARRAPPSRPAAVARRRPPSNTPPPRPQIAMPAPKPAPTPQRRQVATPKPPSDAALAVIKPAAGPRKAAPTAKPPLAAPEIKKRVSIPAATPAAVPPTSTPAKRAPVPATPSAADIPPPPPPPGVTGAPRVPVTATPTPAPKAVPAPKTQVAGIPRTGSIAKGGRQRIVFAPGSAKLEGAGKATLAAIAKSLAQDPARRVELRAYARGSDNNVSQARRLSLSRALAIRSALIAEGVKPTRIDVRALGNRVPSGIPNRVDLSVFTR